MFGLRRRREAAAAEAARREERRATFAALARRPENICPFLGLAYERTGYVDAASIEHRCFALGEPAPLSAEQQTRVCQQRGHGQCPRYLRGLLATPSEELEALRNPSGAPRFERGARRTERPRRGRRAVLILLVVALLAGGAAAAAYALDVIPL